MQRILIIGCPGAGKTTLARVIADKKQLPLIHLDVLFWRDSWQHVSREEFDRLLQIQLEKPQWIIDGNFSRTMEWRLKYCDTVIYLDLPRYQCLFGALKRLIANYGKSREDMGGNCPEVFDKQKIEFLRSIWNFNKQNKSKIFARLAAAKHTQIIVLKSRREVDAFLSQL